MSHTDAWAKSVPSQRILSSEALRLELFSIFLRVLIYTCVSSCLPHPCQWQMCPLQCSHSQNSPDLYQSKSLLNLLLPFYPYSVSQFRPPSSLLRLHPLTILGCYIKNVTCQFPASSGFPLLEWNPNFLIYWSILLSSSSISSLAIFFRS